MKKLLCVILGLLFTHVSMADTVNIDWLVDSQTYTQTSCTVGGDIILPTAPTKRGHTFLGWIAYTPIEYIESTGTQWIDTGYIPNQTTKFRVKLNMTAATGDMIIAAGADYRLFNYKQKIYFDYGSIVTNENDPGRISGSVFKNGVTYDFLVGNHYVKNFQTDSILLGNVVTNPAEWTGSTNITICSGDAKGKIFLLQIWDNNILVRDFIPVLDGNGVVCMYDKVSQTFFYNAGTGKFIAGSVVQ